MPEPLPRILIIYIGTKAKELAIQVDQYIRDQDLGASKIIRNETTLIYADFVRAVDEAEAVIAIVTPDRRPASRAGNLWFELGHWMGSKRRQRVLRSDRLEMDEVLVLQEVPTPRPKRWPVEIISDIGTGVWAPTFATPDQMLRLVGEKCRAWQDRRRDLPAAAAVRTGEYPLDQRVKDTLGRAVHEFPAQLLRDLADRPEADTDYQYQSLRLIAELLRMGRTNREHAFLETTLCRLGEIADQIPYVIPEDRSPLPSERKVLKDKMDGLYDLLREIDLFAREYLARRNTSYSSRDPVMNAPYEDPWKRVEAFLDYRFQFSDLCSGVPHFADLRGKARRFCQWARGYGGFSSASSARAGYLETQLYRSGEMVRTRSGDAYRDTTLEEIDESGQFARESSAVLRALNECYFSACRAAMTEGWNRFGDDVDLSVVFRSVCDQLPQSSRDAFPLAIWPREF